MIIKKSRLEYLFSITLTWTMCVRLSVFRRAVSVLFFFQFSLLFFIKIKNLFWIRVSCHLLNDISKNCNFYRVPLKGYSWFLYIVRFIVVSFTKFIIKIDRWMRVRDAFCAWTRECKICRLGPAYFFVLAHFFHVSNQSLELKESLFKLICEHPMIRINFNEMLICSSKHLT